MLLAIPLPLFGRLGDATQFFSTRPEIGSHACLMPPLRHHRFDRQLTWDHSPPIRSTGNRGGASSIGARRAASGGYYTRTTGVVSCWNKPTKAAILPPFLRLRSTPNQDRCVCVQTACCMRAGCRAPAARSSEPSRRHRVRRRVDEMTPNGRRRRRGQAIHTRHAHSTPTAYHPPSTPKTER